MKKAAAISLVLFVGFVVGRLSQQPPVSAQQQPCAQENGDVNGDGIRDITDAVYLLNWLFQGGSAPVRICLPDPPLFGLPDTGQTICYDQRGRVVDCASDTCAGQDSFYATGCPTGGRFIDNGDGTVTDNCTGLMWQKETADVNDDGLTDWRDRLLDRINWCSALAYCENLKFAGYDDWRLPNVRELLSIIDYGRTSPAIDPVFGALGSWYWSSSSGLGSADPRASFADRAKKVAFGTGLIGHDSKFDDNLVRAVRTAP